MFPDLARNGWRNCGRISVLTDYCPADIASRPILALVGPTAIGKTALSLEIAHVFNCEIVSVDSMQVYKYMDIGTAKIRREEMEGIPHHLLDIVTPDQEYDAASFVRDATKAVLAIWGRGRIPLFTGGTGLYLKAFTEGLFAELPKSEKVRNTLLLRAENEGCSKLHEELTVVDPETAARVHPHDKVRILRGLEIFAVSGTPWSVHLKRHQTTCQPFPTGPILQIALHCDRDDLYRRINQRAEIMLKQGLEGEVLGLLAKGYGRQHRPMVSIGYKHMLNYLDSTWTYAEMLETLKRDTRRYAKRQFTWFRAISDIEWHDVHETRNLLGRIASWLDIALT